jgi:23S rRNA (adenine2503-C2)-methyltransferase
MIAAVSPAEERAPTRLAGATRVEIARALAGIGVPEGERKMRVSQLWHWIYHRGARDFLSMRNIAKPLLETLAERHELLRPEVAVEQVSADGTRKWLIRLPPAYPHDKGAEIECVYIPESDRGTLCVSSQVGCTLNCTFCHTGSAISRAERRRPMASCHRAKACARSRTSFSWAWESRSTIFRPCATPSRF